jgi:hypothetical protein
MKSDPMQTITPEMNHLLRRAGCWLSPAEASDWNARTVSAAVDVPQRSIRPASIPRAFR